MKKFLLLVQSISFLLLIASLGGFVFVGYRYVIYGAPFDEGRSLTLLGLTFLWFMVCVGIALLIEELGLNEDNE